jgi:hypothetical protein
MVSAASRRDVLSRLGGARTTHRVASPAVIIGLGSTACQITQHLEVATENWSANDKKSLGFLYLDTREATRDEISRAYRFIPLTLPHFSNPRDLRGHIDSLINEVCPYYEGKTYLRAHVVAFLGGGTIGALPVLLAALAEARGTTYNFSVALHMVMPQRGMSRDPDNSYPLQLRNTYSTMQFLRGITGVEAGEGKFTGSDTFTITVYPDKIIEAKGPHFDIALLHRAPKDSIPAQQAHVARLLENLVADAWGCGSDWWARYHETMREANNKLDARFGSISSKEVGLLDGFFNLTALQYLQTKWNAGAR